MEGLIIVGHGSDLPQYARVIEYHRERVEKIGMFKEVKIAFINGEPKIEEVLKSMKSEKVFIVPFFMSYGVHTTKDIPEVVKALKSEKEIVICEPVGSDELVTFAILNRVLASMNQCSSCKQL